MNERIKELWNYAADTTKDDSWESQSSFIEQFAELIVRECIDIADDYDGVGITITEKIKKHFGIEE